jgi:hypothetical protein
MADDAEPSKIASTSAVLLCFAAGVTDILSYMTLGSIFTSAMTGCAALFFVKVSAAQYPTAVRAALAICSYLAGCMLAAALQPRDEALVKTPFTLRRLLLAECVLLGMYVIVAAKASAPARGPHRHLGHRHGRAIHRRPRFGGARHQHGRFESDNDEPRRRCRQMDGRA